MITGAGVSTESGVPTFRGPDGLWGRYRAEDLATPQAFEPDPRLVWEWYDWRRQLVSQKEPNAGYVAIAAMEGLFEEFLLITQNVDGLHRKAGSRKLIEIHGNLWRVWCMAEGTVSPNTEVPLRRFPPGASAVPFSVQMSSGLGNPFGRKTWRTPTRPYQAVPV